MYTLESLFAILDLELMGFSRHDDSPYRWKPRRCRKLVRVDYGHWVWKRK